MSFVVRSKGKRGHYDDEDAADEMRGLEISPVLRDDYGKPWDNYPRPALLEEGYARKYDDPDDEVSLAIIKRLNDLASGELKRPRLDRYTGYKKEAVTGFRDEPIHFGEFLAGPPPCLSESQLKRWARRGPDTPVNIEADKWGLQYLYSITPIKNFDDDKKRGRKLVAADWEETEDGDKNVIIAQGASEALRNGRCYSGQ